MKQAVSANLDTDFVSMANLFDAPVLCGQLNRIAYERSRQPYTVRLHRTAAHPFVRIYSPYHTGVLTLL
jgi:hypothetical protein